LKCVLVEINQKKELTLHVFTADGLGMETLLLLKTAGKLFNGVILILVIL
jgi:hypothetical protein